MYSTLKNTVLIAFALLVGFILIEGLSRLVYPVQYGHKYYDTDGAPIHPMAGGRYGMAPSLSFYQRTQEFDKLTTHTPQGFRGLPENSTYLKKPDIIFIGDSMTYGIGLGDEETIPYQFCKIMALRCLNLGRPGTSTKAQLDMLEIFLRAEKSKPRRVHLIMNVMTTAQFGGNDLTDNLYDKRVAAHFSAPDTTLKTPTVQTKAGWRAQAFAWRKPILAHSNLARLTYYVFGPMVKTMMAPDIAMAEKELALQATGEELQRLDTLARKNGFSYSVILVHPVHDLLRGTYEETFQDMSAIMPENGRLVSTAQALLREDNPGPQAYYYPLDGHVTVEGAALIADHLAAWDKK